MKTKLVLLIIAVMLLSFTKQVVAQVPTLGTASTFSLFTAVGAFDNLGASHVSGDVGTNAGAFTGYALGTFIGQTHVINTTSASAATDVDVAYAYLEGISCGVVIGTTLGNGQVLSPNVYCLGGISTLNGELVLDGLNNPDAIFVIKISGAFSTTSLSNVKLINQASLCNVFWQINGTFTLGDSSAFYGTVITNGAINLLEAASLNGRALSRSGAIALHNNQVVIGVPPIASTITAGGVTTFCEGGSVVLSGNSFGTWSNGATTESITVTTSGDFYSTNTSSCGNAISNHIAVTVNPVAIASVITAGSATSFCTGSSVVLSGNVGGTWNTGATTATLLVSTAGDFYVTNTTSCGSATSNHIAVTINTPATASTISAGTATTFCEGGSVILSGNVGGIWSTGVTTASITVSTSGNYFVTNTGVCGDVTSNHIIVTVNPLVVSSVITAGGATTFCADKNVILSGNVGGTWNTGATTATLTVNTAGDYYVTNTTVCDSATSNHIVISINPLATASTIIAEGPIAFCLGNSVILSGNTGGTWNTSATTSTITVTTGGDFYVTNTNACGDVTSNHIFVIVNELPVVNAGLNVTICGGTNATLGSASIVGHTYLWSPTVGLSSSTISNPIAIPAITTTYILTETVTATGCVNTNSVVVSIASTITTEPVNQESCAGSSVSYSVAATGEGLTYQWRKGTVNLVNGVNISGATSALLTISNVTEADSASNYNVQVISTSANVVLSICLITSPPPAFNTTEVITITPNPFKTDITITINDANQIGEADFSMYSVLGDVVLNTILVKKTTTLDISAFPAGVYVYKVISNDILIQSGKLISQ